jgi:TIR domain
MNQTIEIFCCVAELDRFFLGQLSTHLALQQQQGIIKLWDKSQIPLGATMDKEIQRHLASARIFLLLISSDFLADDYCYNTVMRTALEKHAKQEAITIPVIVRPANWMHVGVLQRLQVLPRNGQPISGQHDRDKALWEVANEIAMAIQRQGKPPGEPNSEFKYGPYGGISSPQTRSGPNTRAFPKRQPPITRYPPMTGAEKIYSPPGNKRKRVGVILVVIALVIILSGGTAFALYAKGSMTNGGAAYPLSTQSSSTSSVTTPVRAQDTPTTASTLLPTASLSSPHLPLTLPCVNCSYPQLSVALNRIDIDSPARSTRWVFSFQNSGQHPCSPSFSAIYLTDPGGTNYSGQGQVSKYNSFAIDVGQSVQETSVFAVLPASGTEYTLTLEINVGECSTSGSLNPYQTENFLFA